MTQTLLIEDLKCVVTRAPRPSSRVLYMIYPEIEGISSDWLGKVADEYDVGVVMVYVPADEWNNYLTPWPEPGETPDSPPFGGKAREFLALLEEKVVPEAEKILGCGNVPTRYLAGVSLSGLFTLWQWMLSDTFASIASLSGSFWYAGFMEWFEKTPLPAKTGSAYFLLGRQEPHAHIKAYRSVGENTEAVVNRLQGAGVKVRFDWVPGNHFSDPLGRAALALGHLLG